MKLVSIFTLIIWASTSIGQTNIISNKSHSGNLAEVNLEKDNFGMPAIVIDSIIYDGENCIIEVSTYGYQGSSMKDTVCNHPYFVKHGYNLNAIKEMYPSRTVFVGFEEMEMAPPSPNGWPIQNGTSWLIGLISCSILGFTFLTKEKK